MSLTADDLAAFAADTFPVSAPPVWETGKHALYVDVAALLDGDLADAPAPDALRRTDGIGLFYNGQVNLVFGDPESGKSWICLAAISEALSLGRRAVVIDLDHNGPSATVQRLLMLGAPEDALRDPERFRYVEPEDGQHLVAVVRDAAAWPANVAMLDSIGELLPLFGLSSNSPDDFTRVHSIVMKPLAMSGAAVLAIDHLAKNTESRAMGSTGTAAKKRAVGGVSLRVNVVEQFVPGQGGAANVTIAKDRHGGLRSNSPTGDKEPLAGTFRMRTTETGETTWSVIAPDNGARNPAEAPDPADVAALRALDPPPTNVRDVVARMKWRTTRAGIALKAYRAEGMFPVSHTQGRETGNACPDCGLPGDSTFGFTMHNHTDQGA